MTDLSETRNSSASVRRALTILDHLSTHMDEGGLTLADLARGTQIHKSTLLRLLDALHEFSLVEKDPTTERYRLGLKVLQLASAYLDNMELRSVASPFLQQLMAASGETVHLAVMEDCQAVYIDKVEGPGNVRLVSRIGGHNPLYCTAMGKALLASLPETILDEVVRRGLPPRTSNTLTTLQALQEDLTCICSRGYAIDDEENELGVRCVGAALFDHKGYPIAAISVSGPTMRVTWDHVDQLGRLIKQTAEEISQHLGYRLQTRT